MKRRIISIVMALALCLGLLPAPAWAVEADPDPQELELDVGNLPAGTQMIFIKNNTVMTLDGDGDPTGEAQTFSYLTLTGRAQGIGIVVNADSADTVVELTFRNLDITSPADNAYIKPLEVMDGTVEIKVVGNVSLSAPQMAISVGGRGTTPTVSLVGSGSLTVRQTQGSLDCGMIEHNSASPLTISIMGDVRMEAPNGYLFDNKRGSDIYPISIEAGNITLSDNTGSTGFDGVTLVSSGTLSVNGQSPVALVRVNGVETYYTDIQEAWTAATAVAGTEGAAAVTLTLLKDVTANQVMVVEKGNITFSGGQYTLTGPKTGQYVFCAKNSGTLTINSGTVKGVQKDADVIWATEGGTVVIAGGTINATNCSGIYIDGYDDSDRGTAKITGGTIEASAYGINKSGRGILELSGGTISSGDKAISCPNSTLRSILKNDGAVRYAYYRNNTTPITDGLYDSVLSAGSYTIKQCGHERATTAPIAGTETHSVSCPACGHTGTAETCAYETWVDQGDGTHKGVCVCGREKTEAHTCAEKWSPVWNEREVTITYPCEKECGYAQICGKVTVSADHLEIPYGKTQTLSLTSTLPGSTFTWTVSSDQGGGEAADTPLSTENSCTLPGDWNVGEYHVSWAVAWPDDGGDAIAGSVEVTVTPAALTGKPAFGSGEGKTLGEVEVTLPEGWPEDGTFTWEAGDDTQVVRGTSYAYTYTSPDGNYAASGSVVLWAAPSTGGGGGGYIPPTPPVTTTGQGSSSTTTTTTAVPTASVSGGTATAAVDTSMGNEMVKQATANNSEAVVIAPKITGDVSKTEVSIPASTVGQIGGQTGASLTVSTPVADVTIPNGGLGSLGSAGGTVTVAAEKTGNTVELTVTAGGRAVESVPGGVTLTVPAENTTPGTVAVLVHGDGTREVVRKSVAEDGSVTIPLDGSAKLEIVDNSRRFTDVPATGWKAEAAAFVSSHELFNGTAPGKFSPDAPMSRGMLAVVLHNLENNPAQALTGAFGDVDNSQWYAEGVAWAEENGIVNGYGNGQFGPGDSITREQAAVMLWRYAGSPAAMDRELRFADADEASDWAVDALCWAAENGILNGKAGGILDPAGQATRAEAAQMLKNFMERQ